MTNHTRFGFAAALLTGTMMVGGFNAAIARDSGAGKRAAVEAKTAQKALAKRNAARAVLWAEEAVAHAPDVASYRTLLGQSYISAGRFSSATAALADALTLDPNDGVAALHLALSQIATGDWTAARKTLVDHETTIPAGDRGLAMALAGAPEDGVAILNDAARQPGADAKTRQNLALSLALAGHWTEAKTVAALDVAPAEVDKRIMQWAQFAKPVSAFDQVASLLGVTPVVDAGQPARLALNTAMPAVAVAQAQPTAPAPVAEVAEAPVTEAPAAAADPVAPVVSGVTFADRAEVVQTAPAGRSTAKAAATMVRSRPVKVAKVETKPTPRTPARGAFYVQLGAFENAAVAKDAWGRISRRHAVVAGYMPYGMSFTTQGATFYRLTVGGFARADADALCRKVKARGGPCFVRAGAGDSVALWLKKGVQLASR